MYKAIVGIGSLGLVLLLTCRTSEIPLPDLATAGHVIRTRQLAFYRPAGPIIQAWQPSVFDRKGQQPQRNSTNAAQFQRPLLNDTADDVMDWLVRHDLSQQDSTRARRTTWAPFESPRVEHPLFHRKSRI